MSRLLYMASPYSHPNPIVRHQRYLDACKAAGRLMKSGHAVFAPIPHSVAIEALFEDGTVEGHLFWMAQDLAVLERCTKLVVLTLDGWEASKGVAAEIEFAQRHAIPLEFMAP